MFFQQNWHCAAGMVGVQVEAVHVATADEAEWGSAFQACDIDEFLRWLFLRSFRSGGLLRAEPVAAVAVLSSRAAIAVAADAIEAVQ